MLRLRPRSRCEPRSKSQTLKRLVKDEYHIERVELLACNCQGQADEDGVENDAKLQDEDGRHLRSIVLDRPSAEAGVVAELAMVIMSGMVTIVA